MKLKQFFCIYSTATGFAFAISWFLMSLQEGKWKKKRNRNIKYNIFLNQLFQQRYFCGHDLLAVNNGLGPWHKGGPSNHDTSNLPHFFCETLYSLLSSFDILSSIVMEYYLVNSNIFFFQKKKNSLSNNRWIVVR